ncbi:MAG TPA: DHH family phosphoesterase [Candidatus Nanoarchaeia archaeon]|nr:DHH family phosphoesterase [Candidatus Nanoarchaeia archaeon]
MLSDKQVQFLQEELASAKNPLFVYDGDADGLASFLLLYRVHMEGRGVILTTTPKLNALHLRRVEEINPDKIFILDLPIVEQDFIDGANRPIFWIDHHGPFERKNVHYFNPKLKNPDSYFPTTRMAYQVSSNPDDMWIAAVGCLADWHMPDFIDQFIEKYPNLLSKKEDLPTTVFKRPVGLLVKMFFFLLKGPSSEVRKCVKILTRIKSPEEILEQQTSPGKYLYKHFESVNKKYEVLLAEAKKKVTRSRILLFYYTENQWSFTSNLANELSALYPKKIIIIARKKSGEMKCSLRATVPISGALEKALVGIDGYGGGHPNACGTVVKEEDWDRFLSNFREETKSMK